MTPREIVLGSIKHQDVPKVPFTLGFEEEVGRRVDAHYGNKDWRAKLDVYMRGVGAVDTDMYEMISPTHRRDAYGGIWRVDCRPWHLEKPPLSEPRFAGYEFPPAEKFFRPQWKKDARAIGAANRGEKFVISGMGWGLFERTWNLRGFENALMDAAAEPEFFEECCERLMQLYLKFIAYNADLSADAIQFGDDWGDQRGIIIGTERWRKVLKPRWRQLYAATHRAGKIAIHHSCGSVAEIIPDLIEIGLDVLESCQPEAEGMNPFELKKKYGKHITFWGCLGSQSTLPHGTPAEIRRQVRRLREEMGAGGGYILSPAKPLQPETPTENAVAAVEACLEGA